MGLFETVADFFNPDVVIREFPNRVADLRAAYEQGRRILRSQTYNVQRIVEAGDEVAVELEWNPCHSSDGPACRKRIESVRCDVSHFP